MPVQRTLNQPHAVIDTNKSDIGTLHLALHRPLATRAAACRQVSLQSTTNFCGIANKQAKPTNILHRRLNPHGGAVVRVINEAPVGRRT